MNQPEVRIGECIRVGDVRACILRISINGDIYAGYYQYEGIGRNPKPWKPIKREVVWDEDEWDFKYPDPDGVETQSSREESMIRKCHS